MYSIALLSIICFSVKIVLMFSAGRANLKILRVCCTIFSVIISKRNFLFEVLSDNSLAGPGSCLARAGDKLGFDVQRRGSQARGGA